MDPRVGVGIFVFKNKKFIMGCRKGAHGAVSWSVPGGNLDFGETIEKAAKREVFEETNLIINNVKIIGFTNDVFKKEHKHYVTIWTTGEWLKGKYKIREPDKFLELGWYDFNHLPKPLFLPWKQLLKSDFLTIIKQALQKSN